MKELKGKNYICTKEGHLNKDSIGWSRKTFNNCNISNGYFRRKIWNHYMWIEENFICAFAIVDLDYVGLIFIDFYDLKNNKEIHRSIKTPLSQGIFINPKIGSSASAKVYNTVINIIGINKALNIIAKLGKISIEANINLDDESLNVLVPWNDKQYHYTSKQLPLKSNGYISAEDKKYYLDNSFTFIDYGRGIWEREKSWY